MNKKIILLIFFIIFSNFRFTSVTNPSTPAFTSSFDYEQNKNSYLPQFTNSSILGNNQSMSFNLGDLTEKHYIRWNFTSSVTNIRLLLMTDSNYVKFSLGQKCDFWSINGLSGTSLDLLETYVMPYDETWYAVFWNDNPTTTNVYAEIIVKQLKAVLLDAYLTYFDSNSDLYRDSIVVHYNVSFNYNIEEKNPSYYQYNYGNITLAFYHNDYRHSIYLETFNNSYVTPSKTEFTFTDRFIGEAKPGEDTYCIRAYYFNPSSNFDVYDDILEMDHTKKVFSKDHGEDVVEVVKYVFILGIIPLVIIMTPLAVFYIYRAKKKKQKMQVSDK